MTDSTTPIVLIDCTTGTATQQGSATMIGPRLALTASHMVYNVTNGPATNIGVNSNGTVLPASNFLYMPTQTVDGNGTVTSAAQDYAVLYLDEDWPAPVAPGWYGYMPGWSGGSATTSGYPSGSFATADETFTLDVSGLPVFDFPTELGPGSSGGPIWLSGALIPTVVGLNSVRFSTGAGLACQLCDATVSTIESFMTALTGQAPAIARLYWGILSRAPDADGWTAWTALYAATAESLGGYPSGAAVLNANLAIVNGFVNSPEFLAQSQGMTPLQFVTLLYEQCFGAVDTNGAQIWADSIVNGTNSWATAANGITQSPQAIAYLSYRGQP